MHATQCKLKGRKTEVTVQVSTFNQDTGETLERKLRALTAPGATPIVGLVIDLRGNLGGHFPSGVEAAKLFLPSDVTVVATVDRTGKPSPILTFGNGQFAGRWRPTYLLVDRGTA